MTTPFKGRHYKEKMMSTAIEGTKPDATPQPAASAGGTDNAPITPAPKPGEMSSDAAKKVLADFHLKKSPAPAGQVTVDGNKAKDAPVEPSGTTDPTGEEPKGETPAEGATELTPRLQKALDSVKGTEATKAALAADPEALERLAKQREAIARANGRLGAYTRQANKARAEAETDPAHMTATETNAAQAAKAVETEPETTFEPLTEETFYEKGPKAVDFLRKENAAFRKELGALTERLDAKEKREQDDQEIHQTQVFDDFLAELDPGVYPQYGAGTVVEIDRDDPAYKVRNGLWSEYLDVIEDSEARGIRLTEIEAVETAFFHIHRETPTKRKPKATAKKPTATVQPTGNPAVRTPRQAEHAEAKRVLRAFNKGEPVK